MPNKTITSDNIEDLNKWERLLIGWKARGRTGFTIQAICALTGASQTATWSSIQKSSFVYGQYCSDIHAPVWAVSIEGWAQVYGQPVKGCIIGHKPEQAGRTLTDYWKGLETYVNMTDLLLEKYPVNEGWVTVEKMKGMKEFVSTRHETSAMAAWSSVDGLHAVGHGLV